MKAGKAHSFNRGMKGRFYLWQIEVNVFSRNGSRIRKLFFFDRHLLQGKYNKYERR